MTYCLRQMGVVADVGRRGRAMEQEVIGNW
jgi:hypothetical protein